MVNQRKKIKDFTKEERREYNRQASHRCFIKNPKGHRTRMREYAQRQRLASMVLLGGKCLRCGFNDIRALQVDHVLGGGKEELRRIQGVGYSNHVIKSILAKEEKYQLLCANCNWIKRHENNETRKRVD